MLLQDTTGRGQAFKLDSGVVVRVPANGVGDFPSLEHPKVQAAIKNGELVRPGHKAEPEKKEEPEQVEIPFDKKEDTKEIKITAELPRDQDDITTRELPIEKEKKKRGRKKKKDK
jgi:hypothetical protein